MNKKRKKKRMHVVLYGPMLLGAVMLASSCQRGTSGSFGPSIWDNSQETLPESTSEEPSTTPGSEETDAAVQLVVQNILLTPPEGFEEETEGTRVLYSPDYADDNSFISISRQASDLSVFLMSQDAYTAHLTEEYQTELNRTLSIEMESQTITTVDGLAALCCKYTIYQEEQAYYQMIEYTIQADYNYQIVFADGSEGFQWEEAFEDAAQTISVILEEDGAAEGGLYQDLTWYEADGFRIAMASGMEEGDSLASFVTYEMEDGAVSLSVNRESLTDLEGLDSDASIEDYAAFMLEGSGMEDRLDTDYYGNQCITYMRTSEEENDTVCYLVFQKEGENAWTFLFSCPAEEAETYLEQFALWASSIQF